MNALSPEAEEYLAALRSERGLADNTVAAYRRDLTQYFAFLNDPDTAADASAPGFVGRLATMELAPSTIARKLAAVRGYHRFLVVEGHAADDPTILIDTPKRGRSLPKALRVDEVLALLEAPDTTRPLDVRDRALLEFLYATGCRVTEAITLRLQIAKALGMRVGLDRHPLGDLEPGFLEAAVLRRIVGHEAN